MRRKKADKIPDEWVWCPRCGMPYGFINCRISLNRDGKRTERCLRCAIEEKEEGVQ